MAGNSNDRFGTAIAEQVILDYGNPRASSRDRVIHSGLRHTAL